MPFPADTRPGSTSQAALAAAGFPGALTSQAKKSLRFPWVTVAVFIVCCAKNKRSKCWVL